MLLAAFNGSRWIHEQIESILRQIGVDVSIVVKDDVSDDKTAEVVALFLGDGRVKISSSTNPTKSAAQNFFSLIRENEVERFDFVAFSDQDDVWDEDRLLRASLALTETGAAGYSSSVTAVWSDGRELLLRQKTTTTIGDFLFEGAGQGCTFVLRADFYSRVRMFITGQPNLTDDIHYHDWAVYALVRSWGLDWFFDRRSTLRYRQHEANDTGARSGSRGICRRVELITSGWYRRQLCAIAKLCLVAAPHDFVIKTHHFTFNAQNSWRRSWHLAKFSLKAGRRRASDRLALFVAALVRWI